MSPSVRRWIVTVATLLSVAGWQLVVATPVEASTPAVPTVAFVMSSPTPTDDPVETRPPASDNPFIPDDKNLTECISAVERPGCGSESRGGWHQYAVLAALGIGMLIVYGNIVRGVRRNRK